ncbi:MAG: hypothetical protein ACYC8W_06150 [Candidatus Tyrphobacter sp.]
MVDSRQIALFEARRERDRILDAMNKDHRIYLEALRSFAREHSLRNPSRLVTIDDVRRLMEARDFPLPGEIGADERILGAVFRCKDFKPVGQRPTARLERIARCGIARSNVTIYTLQIHRDASADQAQMRPLEVA